MFTIIELRSRECRGPMTARPPHFFCGEPTDEGESYCPGCKARYHRGKSRTSLMALVNMIYGVDNSVVRLGRFRKNDGGHVYFTHMEGLERRRETDADELALRIVADIDRNGE